MRSIFTTSLLLLGLLAIVIVISGCYSRVVRATGPGASQYKIEQGNLDEPPKPAGQQ